MSEGDPGYPVFFERAGPFTALHLAEISGASIVRGPSDVILKGVGSLDAARATDLAYALGKGQRELLSASRAGAVLVGPDEVDFAPASTTVLVVRAPQVAFVACLLCFFPSAAHPSPVAGFSNNEQLLVHPTARIEPGVRIEPGAVIGAGAEIGEGSVILSNAVIGYNVRIGRHCAIGASAVVQHALLGDRVIIHPGARVGQDGFGYVMRAEGHLKVPQIGRVVIQNDVEIGANTCIDRGALADTIIGEGTKIDNLVQIAHNCVIGRHCVIAGGTGLSGSVVLGDYVALGGAVGVADHRRIGSGARIAAHAGIMHDVPAGETWMGVPAKPIKQAMREIASLTKMVQKASSSLRSEE
jgi:UDP-3-O-[3-hydroxymyristoyl] glucosamine N-acyltransferase